MYGRRSFRRGNVILLSGKVGVSTTDGLRVATVTPVTIVGEMGFITRRVRSATVEAIQPTSVLIITKTAFDHAMHDDQDMQVAIYRNIIDILCTKLTNDNMRMRDYLLEKVYYESSLEEQDQRIEMALDLLMEYEVMPRDKARAHIEEKMIEINPRILVVDDEEPIRSIIKKVLSTFVVLEAEDGRAALEIAQSQPLDLVITEIKMPELDGFGLLTYLRHQYPDLPVLALSGIVGPDEIEGYAFDAFIEKPVRLDELRELVEKTLSLN